MRGAGPVQALTNGALSQPSPEKSVEELRTPHHEGGGGELHPGGQETQG